MNTLLIDGNWFLHSRLFVLPWKKGHQLLSTPGEEGQLMRKLMIDLASEVRKIKPLINDVVVMVDDKSWRKDQFPEAAYKGTRVQDDSVNWDAVFRVYEGFQKILVDNGVRVLRVPGAEADDLLFSWSLSLNNNGKSCIILTGDRDMIQLVNYNEATQARTTWYSSSKGLVIIDPTFNKILNESSDLDLNLNDIFSIEDVNPITGEKLVDRFQNWITTEKLKLEEVDSDVYVLSKILQGDKSDNIPSVITWQKENKNGKIINYSISEKIANKVINDFLNKLEMPFNIDMIFNTSIIKQLVDSLYDVVGKMSKIQIEAKLNLNIALILLHRNTIPEGIQRAMFDHFDNSSEITSNLEILSKMETILEGTKWIKDDVQPDEFDPFAELNDETKDDTNDTKIKELF